MHSASPPPSRPRRGRWPAFAAIAAIVCVLGLSFAWAAGWLPTGRLTAQRLADAIETGNSQPWPGFRRAHAKGLCVSGWFEGSAEGAALSRAAMLAPGRTPLSGRMSIGGGNPHGAEADARVRSMALRIEAGDGHEWRMAMNSFPFFGSASLEDFHAQTLANTPDPATGKPDPERVKAFVAAHPAAQRFAAWAKDAPWSTSWANTAYNSVNTFRFIDAAGKARNVRWSMQPLAPFEELDEAARGAAGPDYLAEEFQQRLAHGPVVWDMVVTLAAPGDSATDPSIPWPEDRERVTVGRVVIDSASAQATGECRDINFDPLVLPPGIEGSEDPILAARSAVYSVSFNRRERDIARGEAAEAIGETR